MGERGEHGEAGTFTGLSDGGDEEVAGGEDLDGTDRYEEEEWLSEVAAQWWERHS